MIIDITREELISICEDAVVHHTKWHDRDSYIAQVSIQDIHKGLSLGLDFIVTQDENFPRSYNVEFTKPIDKEKLSKHIHELEISSREDYFKECDPDYETEMFDAYRMDFSDNNEWLSTFMPTRKRLEEANGGDWY